MCEEDKCDCKDKCEDCPAEYRNGYKTGYRDGFIDGQTAERENRRIWAKEKSKAEETGAHY